MGIDIKKYGMDINNNNSFKGDYSGRNEYKEKRVMMYFIEATQELILDEGLEKLSIKKIAEKAGYNSATIYNYFENLEVLIFMHL